MSKTPPSFLLHPDTPFPVGVEYYRAPIPKQSLWDEDFARIRAAGMHIVRSFSFWNWMEPAPGSYQLDDFDLLFDLAEKHSLFVWLDLTLATHGACPEWLTRQHPDIAAIDAAGRPAVPWAGDAAPQGGMNHCYDHPLWREYGGRLLRHVVDRYKDRPNLLVWGLWDGICPGHLSAFRGQEEHSCYCEHTLARYYSWLRRRFSLEQYNDHTLRRHATWDDVVVPRSASAVVEMRLLQEFHRDNLVSHLDWMVDETRAIDPRHEVRAHGSWRPRPWDEVCAARVDSWGMSMPSHNLLTSDDPHRLAERAFIFDLCRSIGVDGRWWNEEIYSGMAHSGTTWKKQSDPREVTMLMWMSLAHGAAGAMFWQYRPEYLSFEAPGFNLIALDGETTPRFTAVVEALGQLEHLRDHLPIECPKAQVGIVYHPQSQELFGLSGDTERFNADLRGVYRTLWSEGIPADVLTPNQDWSGYRLIFLPNAALMTDVLRARIEQTLDENPDTRLVAEGSFGLYSEDGQSSYGPPEGFMDRLGMRVADFSMLDELDIAAGHTLKSAFGVSQLRSPCSYAVLEAKGKGTREIAHLGASCVGLQTADARFTWFGLTLSAGFGDVGNVDVLRGLTEEAGVRPPVVLAGDRVIPVVRDSGSDGRIIFLFNLERKLARLDVTPTWPVAGATDLLTGSEIAVDGDGHLQVSLDPWRVAVIHVFDT